MQKNTNPDTNWQKELAESITTISELCNFLDLSIEQLPHSLPAQKTFPLRVPYSFASNMEKANPLDPLLQQILPVNSEMQNFPGFVIDPVGDLSASSSTGIIHKYDGRVLLIMTGTCAINCRYCFRRNFPYAENQLSKQHINSALTYIQNHPQINEVILSGGDPLVLSNARLDSLLLKLINIKHVQRIRIHSRLPVVLPSRIDEGLLKIFEKFEHSLVLVIHCNHGNEISSTVKQACLAIKQCGTTLLNQSVLLAGVNNQAQTLVSLSNQLFDAGILPYYLHLLDKAIGTGHFQVNKSEALVIMKNIQNRLPGYLVPKLVWEKAGALSKIPVI